MNTYWARAPGDVLGELGSRSEGLAEDDAATRLLGLAVEKPRGRRWWQMLRSQFLNPLVVILVVAAGISLATGGVEDALIILAIVGMSGGFGYFQERAADRTVTSLLAMVHARATVRRAGVEKEIDVKEIVPGDIVILSVGATVPGDARVLVSNGLQVDESPLTGESFPVEKRPEPVPADAPLAKRSAAVFAGTHVVSGTAEVAIVLVGDRSELGQIREHLQVRRPPTDFDLGLQRFGNLLASVSILLVLAILVVNVALHRPLLVSLLFSVALAVGLVPELLPAIVTVSLARGARAMAKLEVICKRLSCIEDFGAVDVLCSDKTGTLTEGRLALAGAYALDGATSERVLGLAWLNATFESGYANPIDQALREAHAGEPGWTRGGEVPYDFVRKRLSVLVEREGRRVLVTKGQVERVFDTCTAVEVAGAPVPPTEAHAQLSSLHQKLAEQGMRTLGVAVRDVPKDETLSRESERDMTFIGLVAFTDPAKPEAGEVIDALEALGVTLKVLTGDDHRVARHVWSELRGSEPVVLTGTELATLSTLALQARVGGVDVFAEIDPAQKERVLRALRECGQVVAYLGDGINDAPALRVSDVGISVDGAADVAREAADLVLRRRDLKVVLNGIKEGRRTMVNTIKYVRYTTSANFGNMISMAVASLFLPFLPLLPKQILLNNFLSDMPAASIAGDAVDDAETLRPSRWKNSEIRPFMIVFGSLSSVFDILMFWALLKLTPGTEPIFQTGWFVGSLLTEVLVVLSLRSRKSALTSRPSTLVVVSVVAVVVVAVALPFTGPLGDMFGLVPLPLEIMGLVIAISLAYVIATETVKVWFFRRALRRTEG
jgi:Mg2+-importing ATPase